MSEILSRETLASCLDLLQTAQSMGAHAAQRGLKSSVLAHDAALRAEVERLDEDFRDAHRAITDWMEKCDAALRAALDSKTGLAAGLVDENEKLRSALATATAALRQLERLELFLRDAKDCAKHIEHAQGMLAHAHQIAARALEEIGGEK